ncbi:hypothetical protein CASFOL_039054 [Castilleja foliolosa]|uniref:Uncharacterized protein n=1 Tax=Castilleja foliolosa TaxID=1961234 RepID=A0ABD3BIS9_9LAMI
MVDVRRCWATKDLRGAAAVNRGLTAFDLAPIGINAFRVWLFASSSDDEDDTEEVKAPTSALDCLTELENSLPLKRGLSSCYAGKPKSFGNLTDFPLDDSKDLTKKEHHVNKKRRLLLAHKTFYGPRNENGIYLLAVIFVAEDDDTDSQNTGVGLDQAVINSYPKLTFSKREGNWVVHGGEMEGSGKGVICRFGGAVSSGFSAERGGDSTDLAEEARAGSVRLISRCRFLRLRTLLFAIL